MAILHQRDTVADALLPLAGGLPWNALVSRSPISRLVRPNLGDALMTLVIHCERHHRQIGRVRASLARPCGVAAAGT